MTNTPSALRRLAAQSTITAVVATAMLLAPGTASAHSPAAHSASLGIGNPIALWPTEPGFLSTYSATRPDLATTPNGKSTVIWLAKTHFTLSGNDDFRVAYSRVDAKGLASPAVTDLGHDSVNAGTPNDPHVATAANGAAVIADQWHGATGNWRIEYSRVRPNGTHESAVTVSPANYYSNDPGVAVAPNGTAIVTWLSFISGNGVPEYVTISPSGKRSAVKLVNNPANTTASSPSVAISPTGVATLVFVSTDAGGNNSIVAARISPNGKLLKRLTISPSTPKVIISNNAQWVTTAPNGTTTAAWVTSDTIATDVVHAAQINSKNKASALKTVIGTSSALNPAVSAAPSGLVTLAWSQYDGSKNRIQAAHIAANGKLGGFTNLSSYSESGSHPSVSTDSSGTALIGWQANLTGGMSIAEVARFGPSGARTGPKKIGSESPNITFVKVGSAANGLGAISWNAIDGSGVVSFDLEN